MDHSSPPPSPASSPSQQTLPSQTEQSEPEATKDTTSDGAAGTTASSSIASAPPSTEGSSSSCSPSQSQSEQPQPEVAKDASPDGTACATASSAIASASPLTQVSSSSSPPFQSQSEQPQPETAKNATSNGTAGTTASSPTAAASSPVQVPSSSSPPSQSEQSGPDAAKDATSDDAAGDTVPSPTAAAPSLTQVPSCASQPSQSEQSEPDAAKDATSDDAAGVTASPPTESSSPSSSTSSSSSLLLSLPEAVLRRILGILMLTYSLDGCPKGFMIWSIAGTCLRLNVLFHSVLRDAGLTADHIKAPEMSHDSCGSCDSHKVLFTKTFERYAHAGIRDMRHHSPPEKGCAVQGVAILRRIHEACGRVRIMDIDDVAGRTKVEGATPSERRALVKSLAKLQSLELLGVVGPMSFTLIHTLSRLSPYMRAISLDYTSESQIVLIKKYLRSRTHALQDFHLIPWDKDRIENRPELAVQYASIDFDPADPQPAQAELAEKYVGDVALHLLEKLRAQSVRVVRHVLIANGDRDAHVGLSSFEPEDSVYCNASYHCQAAVGNALVPWSPGEEACGDGFIVYSCSVHSAMEDAEVFAKARFTHEALSLVAYSNYEQRLEYSVLPDPLHYARALPGDAFFSVLSGVHVRGVVQHFSRVNATERRDALRNVRTVTYDFEYDSDDASETDDAFDALEELDDLSLTLEARLSARPSHKGMTAARDALWKLHRVRVLRVTDAVLSVLHEDGDTDVVLARLAELRLLHVRSTDCTADSHARFVKALPSVLDAVAQCPRVHTVQWHCIFDLIKLTVDDCADVYKQLRPTQVRVKEFVDEHPNINTSAVSYTTDLFMQSLEKRLVHIKVDELEDENDEDE